MPTLPDRMRRRAESLARGDGDWQPPPTRDAATVCLLRDGRDGVEVFVMRRTTSMAFAAGMHVFPGGAVEQADADVPLVGADLAEVGRRTSSDDPRRLLVAAARETFEECGVLLAAPRAHGVAETAYDGGSRETDRVALVQGDSTFAELLGRRGLAVHAAALVPFAHWVTPEVEDRRYDTRFFAAAVPHDQAPRWIEGESDRAAWWSPAAALTAYAEGRMAMLPPTVEVLRLLAPATDVADALARAAAVDVWPAMPAPTLGEDGAIHWHLVDARTREVRAIAGEPAASETDGVHGVTS